MDRRGMWQAVLGELEISLSRANFATWFRHTAIAANENGLVVIAVPNIFTKEWLEKKYHADIRNALAKIAGPVRSIEYKIMAPGGQLDSADPADSPVEADVVGAMHETLAPVRPTNNSEREVETPAFPGSLNRRYDFASFVVGSSNELAHAACQAVARHPGNKYNPLFLYGGVGLGKTHLMQAVGNEIHRRQPQSRIEYVTSEGFTNEFLSSLARKKTEAFTDKFRQVDVLIVDDIQFLAGKEKTVEEFFHTFNALHHKGKQIILSSDKPPRAIPTLEERLRSRFEWGMMADIQQPDLETRAAILMSKAGGLGVTLAPDVVEFLARNIKHNIRELEGALTQLLAYCELRGVEPTLGAASGLLSNPSRPRPRPTTPKLVLDKTAAFYDLSIEDLTGPRRDRDIVAPRQVAIYLMRQELNLSYPKIAAVVGGRDHTTAMHSVARVEQRLETDEVLRSEINVIRDQLAIG